MFFLNQSVILNNHNPVSVFLQRNAYCLPLRSKTDKLFKMSRLKRMKLSLTDYKFLFLKYGLSKVSCYFKEQTINVVKACSEQCEFVLAHRIRRGQQIFSLYVKWWGQSRIFILIQQLKHSISMRRKCIGYSLCFTGLFSWDNRRISDDELLRLYDELERVKKLMYEKKENTPVKTDNSSYNATDSTSYCSCTRCVNDTDDEWDLFYSNEFIHIWRREHSDHKGEGIYVYKVYGHFDDVTAEDFFRVQIDVDYRKEWDTNSVRLFVIDSEPETNSDILYWEFQFPKLFCNRDYVCNRRYKIDNRKNVIIIMNESTDHPEFPEKSSLYRVREYWSHMVIKPKDDFKKPGIEFSITYFDNPGVSLPSYVTSWYTVTGMPEYLVKQKNAAIALAERRNTEDDTDNNSDDKDGSRDIQIVLDEKSKVSSNSSNVRVENTSSSSTSFPTSQREKRFLLI